MATMALALSRAMSKIKSIAALQYIHLGGLSTASIDRNPCVLVIETDENLAAKVSLI